MCVGTEKLSNRPILLKVPSRVRSRRQLAVCRAFTTAKRTKRLKRRVEWLIFILIHLDLSPRQARRLYRRRFGIESSYRCAGQVRGWTTSPNAAYRFVLIALSFILLNVWLRLRWLFTQSAPTRSSLAGYQTISTLPFRQIHLRARWSNIMVRSARSWLSLLHDHEF